MKNIYKFLSIFFIVLGMISISQAQKIVRTEGSSQVKQESHMTFIETRNLAIEQAKIAAIENVFGSYVEQQTDMTIEDGMTFYNIIGSTKVRGEWIETIDEPKISTRIQQINTETGKRDIIWVSCDIKGKVRMVLPRAILNYEILNTPNPQSRTTSFLDGEQLYLYFKSPVDGYLSIFLEDDDGVYRLFPYMKMAPEFKNGALVIGDKDYLFFSPAFNSFTSSVVDEMIMNFTKDRTEYNYIYIVFSQDEYVKPTLKASFQSKERIIPSSLSKFEFDEWLSNNRVSSESFQVIKEKISIGKK